MINFVNVAYASTSSSSTDLVNAAFANTGALVEDSFPLLFWLFAFLLVGWAFALFLLSFRRGLAKITRSR